MTTDPSPTPFDEQDLTAFALGELDPAGDTHRAIANALANDPAIRAEIDAIKQSASVISEALAHEPVTAQGGAGILPVSNTDDRQKQPPAPARPARAPLFARPALLAAGLALAAGAAIAVVSMVQPDKPLTRHADHAPPRGIAAVRAALETPVTRSFRDDSIEQVFAAVSEATHAEIEVDWAALEARGLTKETTLTFDAQQMPARELLNLTLGAAWQQVPHPDPVVWTVSTHTVRIEARSAAVQRSLDQAQRVLAQVNATQARMSPRQLALSGNTALQQPEQWTRMYWSWAEASGETNQAGEQHPSSGDWVGELGDLAELPHLEELERAERTNELRLGRSVNRPAAPPVSFAIQPMTRGLVADRSLYEAQTAGRGRDGLTSRYAFANQDYTRSLDLGLAGSESGRGESLSRFYAGGGTLDLYSTEGFVAANGRVVTEEKLSLAQNPAGVHLESIVDAPAAMAPQEEAPDNAAQLDLFEPLGEPYTPGDNYALVHDNPFHTGINDPLSTFSVDVDTAAYAIVRRQLVQQQAAPVPEAVRIEELINYFGYDYAAPVVEPELLENGVVTQASLERLAADDNTFAPFATHIEVTDCPWTQGHQLVRIGIKGMEVAQEERPAAHLTFLLDVSGSMNRENKLPLVKESLKMLLGQLNADDHVSIVVYAGAAGLVLEHASAADVHAIEEALDKLSAGGSTAGGAGIELAYDIAQKHYIDGGVNRVILCTDGDFNVGISDRDALVDLIQDKANPEPGDDGQTRGVYLSAMGFGFGNLNDNMMEPLTNAGNGNYAYIDTADEAHKVMVEQVGGTLVAIAKDVKIQVEFNPSQVLAYRLIGYENRILAAEDFANDTVDAGDIGAGHTVTALYEVVPFPDDGLGDEESLRMVKEQIEALDEALAFSTSVLDNTPLTAEQYDKLVGSIRMMQQQRSVALALESRAKRRLPDIAADGIDMRYRDGRAFVDGLDDMDELLVVNLRYKPVDAPAQQGTSRLIQTPVGLSSVPFEEASEDTRFAAAVAGFGMVLRHSPHRGEADMQWVLDTAGSALGDDAFGYRAGFVSLVEQAAQLVPDDAEKDRNVIAPREGRQPIERRRELGR